MLDALSGFVVVWLHPTPMRPCLDVTIWEVLPWWWLIHAYLSPFSLCASNTHEALCHSLAFYASLHTCLHVLAWVLLDSVSSMLQHDEAMDIWSKPTFVPHRQHPWLFAILLCFPFCSYPGFSVCHVFHVCCFMPFCCALCIFPFNGLSASFFCLCLCMYAHEARMHGARAWSPRRKQKGWGCKYADMSQVAVVSRFRSLAFSSGYVLF